MSAYMDDIQGTLPFMDISYRTFILLLFIEGMLGAACILLPVSVLFPVISLVFVCVLFLVKREWGLYLLIFLTPVAANFAGLRIHAFEYVETNYVPLFLPVALIVFAGIFIARASRVREYILKTPWDAPIILFLFWGVITLFWTPSAGYGLLEIFLLIASIVLYYVSACVIDTVQIHRKFVYIFIIMGVCVAGLTIASLSWEPRKVSFWLTDKIELVLQMKHSETRGKAVANPNLSALILNMSIAVAFCYWVSLKKWTGKYLMLCVLLFLVYGVLSTKSKGGLGSMFVMILFLLWAIPKKRYAFIRNSLLALFSFIALFVFQSIGLNRTPRVLESQELSLGARINMWEKGFNALYSQTAGVGLGIGGYKYDFAPIPYAHSIYFSNLFDFGWIGLILFLFLISLLLIKMSTLMQQPQGYLQFMGIAFIGGMIAVAVHGLVDFEYINPMLWFYLGFGAATIRLWEREQSKRRI